MTIRLNGEPYEIAAPLTVSDLLARLELDPRRVAVEHNLVVIKRDRYDTTVIDNGDEVEIVNLVGGGDGRSGDGRRREIRRREETGDQEDNHRR